MAAQFDRKLAEAKALEARLIDQGRYDDAQVITRLRLGAVSLRGTLKTTHGDNMKLRQRLGLPSFPTEPNERDARYCESCGSYRSKPCPDCIDGQCTMNCGPATVDVRGIFDAADAEYTAADKHALTTPDEARAMRDAVRGMMVRLGLYGLWQACRNDSTQPGKERP